jgi:hypothetical protein
LIAILQETDLFTVETQLENFLQALSANPINETDKLPMSLDTPLVYALGQNKSD